MQSQYGMIYHGLFTARDGLLILRIDKIIHTKRIDNYLKDNMEWEVERTVTLENKLNIKVLDEGYVLDVINLDTGSNKQRLIAYKTGQFFIGVLDYQEDIITDEELIALDNKEDLIGYTQSCSDDCIAK